MGPLRHPRHNWLVAKSDHYQVRKLFRRPSRELAFDPGFARLRSNQISRMVHLVEEVLWSAQRRHPFSRTRLASGMGDHVTHTYADSERRAAVELERAIFEKNVKLFLQIAGEGFEPPTFGL